MADTADSDFAALSIVDRLEHKVWKARVSAYEQLANEFADEHKDDWQIEGHMKRMICDANAVAQEAALAAILSFVRNVPDSASTKDVVVPLLIEKAFGSNRTGTRKKALDIAIAYIENGQGNATVELLLPGIQMKQPRAVTQTIACLKEAVSTFGPERISFKPIQEKLPQLFAHTDKSVRTEAAGLTVEMYKFIGAAIEKHLNGIKPVQLKELQDAFSTTETGKVAPTKVANGAQARSQRSDNTNSGLSNHAAESADDIEEAVVDPYDNAKPVDVSTLISGQILHGMAAAKWKERKEALENTLEKVKVLKIADTPLHELVNALGKRIADTNIICVVLAAQCLEALALGLRSSFGKYRQLVNRPMIDRLKEKKPSVYQSIAAGLDAIYKYQETVVIVEEMQIGITHKNPQVRRESLKIVSRHLQSTHSKVEIGSFNTFEKYGVNAFDDSDPAVREAAAELLGTVMKLQGKAAAKFLEKLDDIKANKVRQYCESVQVAYHPSKARQKSNMPQKSERTDDNNADEAMPTKRKADGKGLPGPPNKRLAVRNIKGTVPKNNGTGSAPRPSLADVSNVLRSNSEKNLGEAKRLSGGPNGFVKQDHNGYIHHQLSQEFPIVTSEKKLKYHRAKKDANGAKWSFDTPRDEHIQRLASQCEQNFTHDIHQLMFSSGHHSDKDNLTALTLLDECIKVSSAISEKYGLDWAEIKSRCVANCDLLLKYITLRFCDSNTSILIKCLDLLEHLMLILDEDGYHLTENEASAFIPFLINKASTQYKTDHQYLADFEVADRRPQGTSKVFALLLDCGLSSKNAKVRSETLEEITYMLHRNGRSVMLPHKALPIIAQQISDRDSGVRNGALNAISCSYTLFGEATHKYLGRLNEKERSLVEERLKRSKPIGQNTLNKAQHSVALNTGANSSQDDKRSDAAFDESQGTTTVVVDSKLENEQSGDEDQKEFKLEIDSLDLPTAKDVQVSLPHQPTMPASFSIPTPKMPSRYRTTNEQQETEELVKTLLDRLTAADPAKSIELLKQVEEMLVSNSKALQDHITPLVDFIRSKIKDFIPRLDPTDSCDVRYGKHLMNVLVLIFSKQDLAYEVSSESLHELIEELAHTLLIINGQKSDSLSQLAKASNVCIVKILEIADKNSIFSGLLSLLERSTRNLSKHEDDRNVKYAELIMKCLWKLAKSMQEHLRQKTLDASSLLYDINKFFIAAPSTEWKRRVAENTPLGELPLRTVKTLLLELTNTLGDRIYQQLFLIADAEKSPIYPYIQYMLEANKKKALAVH